MVVAIVILVVSFFLDGILSNFLPYMVGDLSLFTPMITIVALVIVYPLFTKNIPSYNTLVWRFRTASLLFWPEKTGRLSRRYCGLFWGKLSRRTEQPEWPYVIATAIL